MLSKLFNWPFATLVLDSKSSFGFSRTSPSRWSSLQPKRAALPNVLRVEGFSLLPDANATVASSEASHPKDRAPAECLEAFESTLKGPQRLFSTRLW